MIASRHKDTINKALEPFVRLIARSSISPSALTLSGPILVSIVCIWFVRYQAVIPFVIAVTAIGFLDGFDGVLARMTNRVTKFGGYLDAVCDRYVESIVIFTVAYVTGYWFLSMIVLTGSLMVSYSKARAAMEVPISNLEWPDLMERAERSVIYGLGLLAGDLMPILMLGRDIFWWTLVVLSVLIHFTVLQRFFRARNIIRERSN